MQPGSVVLTKSTAVRYFGTEDPMGKMLKGDNGPSWTVTGVVEDWPNNSHFRFDFLGALATVDDSRNPTWLSNNYHTYLLLQKGTDRSAFQKKFDCEVAAYVSPQLQRLVGISLEQFQASGNRYGYVLQPLSSIHLSSHLDYELEANGDVAYVWIFSAIALAILLIACINFVNLATARSERRAREVGIRKTLGSNRSKLVGQFLAESVLMSVLAVLLAILLVEVFLPLFNDIAGKTLRLSLSGSPLTGLVLVLLAIGVGFTAGSYPAFYLSSFRPMDVLAKEGRKRSARSMLRSGLVIFQFAVSIVLFIGAFVIESQLRYIQTRNLGFDKEQLLVINRASDLADRLQSFEQELRNGSRIAAVTNSTAIPGAQAGDGMYQLGGQTAPQYEDLRAMWCDFDFVEAYRLTMQEGRFFSREHPSDTAAVVVNEAVAKAYGENTVIGKDLTRPGSAPGSAQHFQIIGMVKDFNFQSLHEPVRPLVLHFLSQNNFVGQFITVRVRPGDPGEVLSFIESVWKRHAGSESISYTFLDQNLERLYAADQRTSTIARIFSILAIFIACLGVLGLAAFVTERRTKEIGIRKALGATVPGIVGLLSSDFLKWVLIANVIAWPAAYYIMNTWLQDFAYRVSIQPWAFVLAGTIALVIAMIAVGVYALRSARANPVESLRYE